MKKKVSQIPVQQRVGEKGEKKAKNPKSGGGQKNLPKKLTCQ